MRFQYCPDCGSRLELREIGDEGKIPFCLHCDHPLFDMFPTCIIVLVVNEAEEAALLQQAYISTQYRNLISGYMKPGETAEFCAKREVLEEIGVPLSRLQLVGTYWFAKKDMLMIGFIGRAEKVPFTLSCEVDAADWIPLEEALTLVHPNGSVSYQLLEEYLRNRERYSFL